MAKDDTVKYHGRALQVFPSLERTSYAGARVEAQEHLGARLLGRRRDQILTHQEAPLLAAELRFRATAGPVVAALADSNPTDLILRERPVASAPGPLAGETI